MELQPFDALVLAGGAARRLGGEDKPSLRIGGVTLLDRVLTACADAGARTLVVVGPERPTQRPVRWVREDPPGGGPVAAIAAGLQAVTADQVLVAAADLPFLDAGTVDRLRAGAVTPGVAVAMLVDGDGRDQPLVAVYRTAPLRRQLATLGDPNGAPLRRVVAALATHRLPDPLGAGVDVDTWEQVRLARARAASRPR
jgi:molybdopterin-guanine dinucleotide biosynthesis protein A